MRLFATLLLLLPAALPASEFDWMTREFARQSGTQPLHIPFLARWSAIKRNYCLATGKRLRP
jgi:hypothetical protein